MANRSYLYALDELPDRAGPGTVRAVSEWNWDIPIVHRVLMTASPRLSRSTIWDLPVAAIVADYDGGVANLERYLAALPKTEEVQAGTAAALTALRDLRRRGRYLLLEPAEILMLTIDDGLEGEAYEAALAEAYEMELAEIGDIDGWLRQAGRIDAGRLAEATGAGSWSTVNYYEPSTTPVAAAADPPDPRHVPASTSEWPSFAPPAKTPWPGSGSHQIAPTQPPRTVPPAPVSTQPYPGPTAPPPSGWIAWAVGLLCLIPLPFLSALVAGIVMGFVGRSQRSKGPLAAGNGRYAASWGFTYALVTVLLGATHITLLAVFTRGAPQSGFFPIGIPITIWLVISVVHVIVCFRGVVVSGRAGVFAPPAIPFGGR